MSNQSLTEQFLNILKRMNDRKAYGSIEIFFEEGKVTQFTERVITKVFHKKAKQPLPQKTHFPKSSNQQAERSATDEPSVDLIV